MSESTQPKTTPRAAANATSSAKAADTKASATTGKPVKGFNQELLISTVQTKEFAWFVGQLFTFIGIFFYTLTYLKVGVKCYKFWYIFSLVGILETFGILLYSGFTKGTQFIKDENTYYFLINLAFLVLRPYVLFTLWPFAIFSLFHILAYTESKLFPIFGIGAKSTASNAIISFTSKYNEVSLQIASLIEIYSLGWLLLRVLTFRKNSLLPFFFFLAFIKVRFEVSQNTRNYFKSLEIQLDDLVNKLQVPIAKKVWLQLKEVLRTIGGIYIVNNYTKDDKVKR